MAPAQASLLAKLDTQERVRDFLTNAVASGRASHAYLFLGAPGAGKLDAASGARPGLPVRAGRCGACDSCVRVARHTHPDVHYYTPESATGYLIAQTRELLDDVPLAPIRAKPRSTSSTVPSSCALTPPTHCSKHSRSRPRALCSSCWAPRQT